MGMRKDWSVRGTVIVISFWLSGGIATAEWYVAGQVGWNFADRLTNVEGTGNLTAVAGPDFDLQHALVYGGKIGYFGGNGPIGIELDAFNSQPNIKARVTRSGEYVPGIHLGVTNVGINLILRYPGQTFQPYAGIGGAALIGRLGSSAQVQGDTDVGFGVNLLAGIRTFVTPYVALFTEYKYTRGTLTFNDAFGSGSGFSGDYRAQHVVFGASYHF